MIEVCWLCVSNGQSRGISSKLWLAWDRIGFGWNCILLGKVGMARFEKGEKIEGDLRCVLAVCVERWAE